MEQLQKGNDSSPVVTFAQTYVRLCNRINVPMGVLEQIFGLVMLNNKQVFLLLDNENVTEVNGQNVRAVTIPSSQFITPVKELKPLSDRIPKGDLCEISQWDALVYVPCKTTERWETHPPYFACFLAHELEHVRIIRENFRLHMCLSWLYKNTKVIFEKGNALDRLGKTWYFPHEFQCHKRGKAVAIAIFGEEVFNQSIADLKQYETIEHKGTLDFLLTLCPNPYDKNISQQILENVHEYYRGLESIVHQVRGQDLDTDFELSNFIPSR